jgi:hypothetical protein
MFGVRSLSDDKSIMEAMVSDIVKVREENHLEDVQSLKLELLLQTSLMTIGRVSIKFSKIHQPS